MKSGICPKCSSTDIVVAKPKKFAADYSAYDYETVGKFKNVFTNRYICCNCGYTERYFKKD